VDPADTQVLVAVKDLSEAKSRLAPAFGEQQRSALVLAMLIDTVGAALRCPAVAGVHVLTRDLVVAQRARAAGARVVPDPTSPLGGLNAALAGAAADLPAAAGVLALQADLPALRPSDLRAVVAAANGARAAVADAGGTGTTLLLAPPGTELDPHFGPGSALAHAASGAVLLEGSWPGLRCDVDTVADLAAALRLGVGPATTALLDRTGVVATVQSVSAGQVRLRCDDGRQLRCPAEAAALGGWQRLRTGQRVRAHHDPTGVVYLLTVAAMSPPG